jgi:hypothetical protein
MTIKLLQL